MISTRRRATIAVVALLAGVVLNVAQFTPIEREVAENWRAFPSYGSSDLDRYPHAERRYGFFVALGEVAPGVTLIVPPNSPPSPTRLESFQPRIYGLGRVAELEGREYDPLELGERIDNLAEGHVVSEGLYESSDGRYRIAVADGDVSSMVFLMLGEHDLLVIDLRLVPDEVVVELES